MERTKIYGSAARGATIVREDLTSDVWRAEDWPVVCCPSSAPESDTEPGMQSKAKTVAEYLASLPSDRREVIEAVRKVILANLDSDYEEGMQYGMIGYYVPHRVHPEGYHCDPKQPFPFGGLASQKNYMSVYLIPVYGEAEGEFRKAWLATGKKLDMGKCCVRFKKLDDVALDVIGATVRRYPAKKYLARFKQALAERAKGKPAGKTATKRSPAKKAASGKSTSPAKKVGMRKSVARTKRS